MAVYDCYFRSLTGAVCAHRRIKKRDEAKLLKIASRSIARHHAAQCEIWCGGRRLYILPLPEAQPSLLHRPVHGLAQLASRPVRRPVLARASQILRRRS